MPEIDHTPLVGYAGGTPAGERSALIPERLEAFFAIAPTPESIAQALAFVEESLDAAAVPAKQKNRLMVAFDDMYANVVNYSGASHASISVMRHGAQAMITLRDNGVAFDPLAAGDPGINLPASQRSEGGLGIYMMKKMMDEVDYVRCQDENILRMSSYIPTE